MNFVFCDAIGFRVDTRVPRRHAGEHAARRLEDAMARTARNKSVSKTLSRFINLIAG
jgi:hypothetical protein